MLAFTPFTFTYTFTFGVGSTEAKYVPPSVHPKITRGYVNVEELLVSPYLALRAP